MTIVNQDQSDRWNSGDDGAHWVAEKDRYDRMFEPILRMLLEAAHLDPGESVLDVGCGSGATTLAAAIRVRPGQVLGLDLSDPMLELARSEAERAGIGNVGFERRDVQVLGIKSSFDVVVSRFGVMFFDDPTVAFASMRAACRPGGRLVFVSWQPLADNEWLLVPAGALAEHLPLPAPPPADSPGMFALSDPDRIRALLGDSGWHDVSVTSRHTSILLAGGGTIDETVRFLRTGSMGRTMLDGVDPETEARALRSVHDALERRGGADGVDLDAAVWLVEALA